MKKRLLSRKRLSQLVFSIGMILLYINASWGQQTIGSFPYINGGFEGQSALVAANSNGSSLGWTSNTFNTAGATNNSAIVTSGARTGNNYAIGMNTTPTATSNFRALQSPTGTGPLANTQITIQF